MSQTPKLAQRLASTLLIGLVLPVSLVAGVQSTFVKGALKQAKNDRKEAHDAYQAQRDITADLKAQRRNATTQAEKDALTAQIRASRQTQLASLASLEEARIRVQLERANRIGGDADTAGLQSLANQARDLAAQIAALDLTTQAGIDEARRLQAELKDLNRNEIKSAINAAKFATASAILEGALEIIAEAGVDVQCDTQVAAFNQQSAWGSGSSQLFKDARACLLGGPIMGFCGEHVGTGGVVSPTGAYGTGLMGVHTGSGVPLEEQPGAVLLPGGGVQAPSDCTLQGPWWSPLGSVYVNGPHPADAIAVDVYDEGVRITTFYYTFGPSGEYQFYETGMQPGPVTDQVWGGTTNADGNSLVEQRALTLVRNQNAFRAAVLGVDTSTVAHALHRWAQANGLSDVTVDQAFYAWAHQNEDRAAKVQQVWDAGTSEHGSGGWLPRGWISREERNALFGDEGLWPNW